MFTSVAGVLPACVTCMLPFCCLCVAVYTVVAGVLPVCVTCIHIFILYMIFVIYKIFRTHLMYKD